MTSSRPITRCHSLKLVNNRYYYDLGKFSFAPRIVSVWNSLPEIVISADTSDAFKIRLDKFWQHHHHHDYKVELTGVGNKSQINADDNTVYYIIALLHCLFFVCTSCACHRGIEALPTATTHLCFALLFYLFNGHVVICLLF